MEIHTHIIALLAKSELDQAEVEWLVDHETDLREIVQEQYIIQLKASHLKASALAHTKLKQLQTTIHHHEADQAGIEAPAIVRHRIHFLRTAWFRYAAILLLIAGAGILFYFNHQPKQIIANQQPGASQDILPGGNRAILTLADGSTIVLDTVANGALASQGGGKVLKLEAGKLAYQGTGVNGEVGFNTISTPRGGQYQIQLPDGSRVWLNAASSVKFPTSFIGNERRVIITGEAYFEIAPNSTQPFFVSTGNTLVQVLGTGFNINAYHDEEGIRTTLLEGSINVGDGIQKVLLKPGQQADTRLTTTNVLTNIDIDKVMAWKNGAFNFNDAGLAQVMHQLERWYDIEVVYEKGVPDITFWGKMSRNLKLSDVLKALKGSGVHFRIDDGRKVIVMP